LQAPLLSRPHYQGASVDVPNVPCRAVFRVGQGAAGVRLAGRRRLAHEGVSCSLPVSGAGADSTLQRRTTMSRLRVSSAGQATITDERREAAQFGSRLRVVHRSVFVNRRLVPWQSRAPGHVQHHEALDEGFLGRREVAA